MKKEREGMREGTKRERGGDLGFFFLLPAVPAASLDVWLLCFLPLLAFLRRYPLLAVEGRREVAYKKQSFFVREKRSINGSLYEQGAS